MAIIAELYHKFTDKNIRVSIDEVRTILAPYIEQFKIKISEEAITFNAGKNPFGNILFKRICAIVDEPEQIYIVLEGCIYTLYKATTEIKMNIKG